MQAIILGKNSEIGSNLAAHLAADGWRVALAARNESPPQMPWDLLILAHGTMQPIGRFFDCQAGQWESAVSTNAFDPLFDLRQLWRHRNAAAKIVFLGGPNMSKPSPTYTAYRASKALLESLVDTLNVEYPEHRFAMLHPGVVRTKLHEQTIAAGARAANIERVRDIVAGNVPTVSHAEVYEKLKALLA